MPLLNSDIACNLDKLADLLELDGANPFRIRAFRNAARVIAELLRSVTAMTAAGEDVAELPGIGQDLADKIETLADTGHLAVVDEIEAHTPAGPTDAHSASELGFIRYAVDQARRGWLEPEDIINPRGLDELRASLRHP